MRVEYSVERCAGHIVALLLILRGEGAYSAQVYDLSVLLDRILGVRVDDGVIENSLARLEEADVCVVDAGRVSFPEQV